MSSSVNPQGEFDFSEPGSGAGYSQWLVARQVAAKELARRMNLPLGHQVEVWLFGGIRLRGQLRLAEETLFIQEDRIRHLDLLVDHKRFSYRDMESCVRTD